MKHRAWTILAAATVAGGMTLATAAAPQDARGTRPGGGPEYRLVVIDRSTNQDLATVGDGETITLSTGQEVGLHVYRERPDGGRTWVDGRFTVEQGGDRVEVEPSRARGGEGELRAVRATPRQSPARVRWSVAEPTPRGSAGVLYVEVVAGSGSSQADVGGILDALYRGILLRPANDSGARDHLRTLERNGWQGVATVARTIADSRESQIQVYEKGACNQERLLALYRHLLDRDANDVDPGTWRAQLRSLEGGGITDVVLGIVDSTDFRRRFGYREGRR